MMNMNKTRIDECMDLLDEEFLTEIEMEELALTEQEQNNIPAECAEGSTLQTEKMEQEEHRHFSRCGHRGVHLDRCGCGGF